MKNGEFSGEDALKKAREIREYSDAIAMPCLQTHTPSHASDLKGIKYFLDGIENEKKAVEISGILGAEVAVVHPTSITDAEGNLLPMQSVQRKITVKKDLISFIEKQTDMSFKINWVYLQTQSIYIWLFTI